MSPIVSPRSREWSRQAPLRAPGASGRREPASGSLAAAESPRPALRIVAENGREIAPHVAPVLLAGADPGGRAVLRAELGATLPPRTRWAEADDVAGVLEGAAHSRMVILTGDLEDADAESLIRLLGRRHPELPVIRVDAPLPAAAGGRD
jgi:hypothetical protein